MLDLLQQVFGDQAVARRVVAGRQQRHADRGVDAEGDGVGVAQLEGAVEIGEGELPAAAVDLVHQAQRPQPVEHGVVVVVAGQGALLVAVEGVAARLGEHQRQVVRPERGLAIGLAALAREQQAALLRGEVRIDRIGQQDAGPGEDHVARVVEQAVGHPHLAQAQAGRGRGVFEGPVIDQAVIQADVAVVGLAGVAHHHLPGSEPAVAEIDRAVHAQFVEVEAALAAVAQHVVVAAVGEPLGGEAVQLVIQGLGRQRREGEQYPAQSAQSSCNQSPRPKRPSVNGFSMMPSTLAPPGPAAMEKISRKRALAAGGPGRGTVQRPGPVQAAAATSSRAICRMRSTMA